MRLRLRISIKPICISLAIVLAMNMYCLYLVDDYGTYVFGITLRDFSAILAIIWAVYYWFRFKKSKFMFSGINKWMLLFSVLIVTSALQSWIQLGQPLLLGIAPQRYIFIWILVYFTLSGCLHDGKISSQNLRAIMVALGMVQMTLFYANSFLDGALLTVNTGVRNGTVRYYYNPILLDFCFCYFLDKISKCRIFGKILYVILDGLILYETMIIQQFRLTSMGLIVVASIFFLLVKTKRDYKLIYAVVGCIVVGILLSTPMASNVIETVLGGSWDNGTKIRFTGKALYLTTLAEHPILGGGYPSTFYYPAQVACGATRFIYLYDNGLVGLAYIYGGVGIVWLVTFWAKLVGNGWKLYQKKQLLFLLYPVFFLVTGINEAHWFWEYGFVVFSCFLALEGQVFHETVGKRGL